MGVSTVDLSSSQSCTSYMFTNLCGEVWIAQLKSNCFHFSATAPVSDLMRRKLRTYFIVLDRNLDGVICESDFVDGFQDGFRKYFDEEKADILTNHVADIWFDFFQPMGKVMDGETKLTFENYSYKHIERMGSQEYRDKIWEVIKGYSRVRRSLQFIHTLLHSNEFVSVCKYLKDSQLNFNDSYTIHWASSLLLCLLFVLHLLKYIDCNSSLIISTPFQVFTAIDANNDLTVDLNEYTAWLKAHGVHPFCAKASFEAMDVNNKRHITLKEFEQAYFDFFMSEKDGPSKLFFGPLLVD